MSEVTEEEKKIIEKIKEKNKKFRDILLKFKKRVRERKILKINFVELKIK